MDQFTKLLNAILRENNGKLNSAIDSQITANGMDPMRSVKSGSASPGSIDLGICTASASANYGLSDLTGLSSFNIGSLEITNSHTTNNGGTLIGSVAMSASLKSSIAITIGGSLKAGCGFLSDSIGLSGRVSITGVTLGATGDFTATVGEQICLTEMHLGHIGINYANVSVHINDLGIFNILLTPVVDLIAGIVKGPVISLIEGAIGNPINSAISGFLPQCKSL